MLHSCGLPPPPQHGDPVRGDDGRLRAHLVDSFFSYTECDGNVSAGNRARHKEMRPLAE